MQFDTVMFMCNNVIMLHIIFCLKQMIISSLHAALNCQQIYDFHAEFRSLLISIYLQNGFIKIFLQSSEQSHD